MPDQQIILHWPRSRGTVRGKDLDSEKEGPEENIMKIEEGKLYAVITGDIVSFSKLPTEQRRRFNQRG